MPDKSTRFTLAITAGFIAVLGLLAWGLKHKGAPGNPKNSAETAASEEPEAAPSTETAEPAAPAPSLPLAPDGKPVADYEVLTDCTLEDDPANDGDTFLIKTPDGSHRFCLYWVDTVETDGGQPETARRMAQHFGFASEEPLRDLGVEAREFSLRLMRTFPVRVVTKWELQPEEKAFSAFVYLMQKDKQPPINLSEYIMRHGLAMIRPAQGTLPDGTAPEQFLRDLQSAEAEARQENRGGWKAPDL